MPKADQVAARGGLDQQTNIDQTINIHVKKELLDENIVKFEPDSDQTKLSPQLRDAIVNKAKTKPTHTIRNLDSKRKEKIKASIEKSKIKRENNPNSQKKGSSYVKLKKGSSKAVGTEEVD